MDTATVILLVLSSIVGLGLIVFFFAASHYDKKHRALREAKLRELQQKSQSTDDEQPSR